MKDHTTRFQKLDYLLDTCSGEFIKDCIFVRELVGWMSEDSFDAFYERLKGNWEIMDEQEFNAAINR